MLQVLHNYAIHSNIYFTVNITGYMRHINCICPGLIHDAAFAALRKRLIGYTAFAARHVEGL